MASRIQGITVEIGGDTTKLQTALKGLNGEIKTTGDNISNAGTRKLPMTEDVYQMFKAIIEDRPTDLPEIMVGGYAGFLFREKNGMPEVAMHWEHRSNQSVKRYNDIFKVQMPNITPHVCRHTYCSNMAKVKMNPKTLQYLMGIRIYRLQ